jgi:hypothetical protein
LAENGHLYPKLYPIRLREKRLAITLTLLQEVAMAGLKQRGSIWYLTYYLSIRSAGRLGLRYAKRRKALVAGGIALVHSKQSLTIADQPLSCLYQLL